MATWLGAWSAAWLTARMTARMGAWLGAWLGAWSGGWLCGWLCGWLTTLMICCGMRAVNSRGGDAAGPHEHSQGEQETDRRARMFVVVPSPHGLDVWLPLGVQTDLRWTPGREQRLRKRPTNFGAPEVTSFT